MIIFLFIQDIMKTENLKMYYYDYVHWCIKNSIYQIRNGNYPLEYWKQDLHNNLELRRKTVTRLAHLVWQPGSQLKFVF